MGERAPGADGASWQQDPFGRHEQRYWDGNRWTERVRSGSTVGIDPPGIDARPETIGADACVEPIDATGPIELRTPNLPRVLAAGVVLLAIIVVVVIVGLVA